MWQKNCFRVFRRENRRFTLSSPVSLSISSLSSLSVCSSPSSTLSSLRLLMKTENLSALFLSSSDPHLSEYIAPHFSRITYLSHFTGSAGTVVITKERALLWTDGRYHLQAVKELSSDWILMKDGSPEVPTYFEYLRDNLSANDRVGYDSTVHSAQVIQFAQKILSSKEIYLVPYSHTKIQKNFIDILWENDSNSRPSLPISSASLRFQSLQFAGDSPTEKLQKIRFNYLKAEEDILVLTVLEEIAWVLNLRGNDVPWNPVFHSYLIITRDSCVLYLNLEPSDNSVTLSSLSPELQRYFSSYQITIRPYSCFYDDLQSLCHTTETHPTRPKRVFLDPSTVNQAIWSLVPEENRNPLSSSPIDLLKACKNTAELTGMRNCHLRDATACIHFLFDLFKLSSSSSSNILPWDEVDIDEKITSLRSFYSPSQFLFPSFATIAGSGPNGAIVHYRAQRPHCRHISREEMLLIDSGGQYEDGTTDITRTIHLGEATETQKDMYTRVLMGHIDLASLSFPAGTAGCLLDSIARRPLWDVKCNYLHGTGHGVGAALCVHEGPQRISSHLQGSKFSQPLLENMIVSIEPGYYDPGQEGFASSGYGIRLENLYIVTRDQRSLGLGQDSVWYSFEPLTYVPFQKNLIVLSLLSERHVLWLNHYHQQILRKISQNYRENSEIQRWLSDACAPI